MGVTCSLWQNQQVWEVQQRSIQVERAKRASVTHLNDSAIGISERQEQRSQAKCKKNLLNHTTTKLLSCWA